MATETQFHYIKAGKVHFFCPLCHHHQSTNTIRRVSWRHVGQLLLLTVATVLVAWPSFGVKGLSLFFLYWGIFEFAYRFRKRQALICQSCGFDPFLYKQDVQKARAALRQHWEKRIESENLFAGKKLKNYRTNPLTQSTQQANPEVLPSTKNTSAPPPSSP